MSKKIILLFSVFSILTFPAQTKKLYGMTFRGGISDKGTLFEYDYNTNENIKKIDFNGAGNGTNPAGSLIQASNGKLYGLTEYGGAYNNGVLFEYDLDTGTLTKKYEFQNTSNGKVPTGHLIQATNGKLYGLAQYGGVNNNGALFEYDPITSIYIKKVDFNSTNGNRPMGSLLQASNGKVYGTTGFGGNTDSGVLFEFDINTGVLTKKVNFLNYDHGSQPTGDLLQAADGNLYGATNDKGYNGWGTIYKYNIATNTITQIKSFEYSHGTKSTGTLMQATNGSLYGMTMYGGAHNNGVLYELNPGTNLYSKKVDFNEDTIGGMPFGSLMQASNNKVYGMTYWGGSTSDGVIFEYDLSNEVLTKKYDFNNINNGRNPYRSYLIEVNVNTNLSVKENASPTISIYPNPVGNIINIKDLNKDVLSNTIELNDSSGKLVLQKVIRNSNEKIDVSHLNSGIYFMSIGKKFFKKIIKK
ncbi:choice-of-anchor tandem repeat GloVer-containing protein [Chryseobacterium sp. Mn2064]|uniref:T9SS type A sorting domain-containing protein n=1 Tax=Chryseobacterium sp. Mn2064 TaxID=3395263 RepID=UPI003BCA5097